MLYLRFCTELLAKAFRGGLLMLDDGELHEPEHRDEGHNRWLAMQSAYAEYTRASELLECTHQSTDGSTTSERLQLTMLEGKQRVAFERYLESRLEFLECRFDQSIQPGPAPPAEVGYSGAGSRWAFAKPRTLLEILAVILLCTTAFSLVREKQRLRKLETSDNGLQVALDETRAELRVLGQKVDAGSAPAGHQASAAEPGKRRGPLPVQQKRTIAKKRSPVQAAKGQSIGAYSYYRFSLGPSRQYTRVGPVQVSLRSVDARRHSANLLIVSNTAKFDVQRAEADQPVWLNVAGNQQFLELVIDRIDGGRLEGHLIEPRKGVAEPRDSRFKSPIAASPS
jgi:hypothetical protein